MATAKKYGPKQATKAIKEGMNGNYAYFTNNGDSKLRDKLKSAVSPEQIILFLNKTIENNDNTINYDVVIFNFIQSLVDTPTMENSVQRL